MRRTWTTAPRSRAPGSLAVSTEASVWTASAATRAPALRGSSVSTARATSTSASPGPATHREASTACSWSTITSATAAWDTPVRSRCLHTAFHFFAVLVCCLSFHAAFRSSRSSLRVNGGSVLVQAVPPRRSLLHEQRLCTWLHLLLPFCEFFCFFNLIFSVIVFNKTPCDLSAVFGCCSIHCTVIKCSMNYSYTRFQVHF